MVADVNGDGKPDILVANVGSSTVGVLLNNTATSKAVTNTVLASSLNPSVYGQAVTFTATVTSSVGTPTGTIQLKNGSAVVASGTLTGGKTLISISSLPAGSDSITATYQGSATFAPSTSAPLSLVVNIATTTTTLASSLNPAGTSQAVTFTATVTSQFGGAATGSVVFLSGSQTLGTASLSGNHASLTTSFSATGTYSISAKYNGDGNDTASTSPVLRQVVNSTTKSATSTTLTSSLNPSIYGQSITFKATVTTAGSIAPTGTVNFTWSGYTIGTATLNSSGVATLTKSNLNVYTYPLVAAYSGDPNNLASTSIVLNQVVKQATSAATLTSSPNPSIQGQAVTFTAKITSPTVVPTGPVTFKVGNTVLGTAQLSGGKATFTTSTLPVGSTIVTVTYPWNSNIASSSASITQTVGQ